MEGTREPVFTLEEVADQLRVHRATVERLLKQGRLRGFKVGRDWRVTERELRRYMGLDQPAVPRGWQPWMRDEPARDGG